jgi:dihydrofolate reductase
MAKVILGVTISLDGFAEDSHGSVGPLYPDLEELDKTDAMKESIQITGAVVMTWKEFTMAEDPNWVDGYEYQVPIFVVGDQVPQRHPKETKQLTFTFVTDGLASAIRQAKHAAGKKVVNIIGSANITQECLRQGLVDEFQLDIIPIFLLDGFRPFENLGAGLVQMERIKVVELPAGRIHIEYRIVK